MARVLAASMATTLGRVVLVDNRPGAAGLLGVRAVQAAAPNGDTFLFTNPGYITLPLLNRGANYDPVRDFTPIGMVGRSPLFLMVHRSVPAATTAELVAYAKTQLGGITAANAGLGSNGHIAAMLFARAAGVAIEHVAYKGTAEAATALMSGEVQMQINATTEALNEQSREGLIRLLAVMSERRSPLAPGVPPIAETFPGLSLDTWFGILGPAGTPPTVVQEINGALAKALGSPQVQERFAAGFIEPEHSTPAELASAIARSTEFWRKAFSELDVSGLRN
jgi:tripartite-type tricarboxylate transporter receptor subunit TctC